MLYPKTNQHRIAISLNGLWNFDFVPYDYSPTKPLVNPLLVGVPSSYNDLFTKREQRDYVGLVAYEKQISIPEIEKQWNIRIGSAGNRAKCYFDGELIYQHSGGFLPLDFPLPNKKTGRLTIILDNRLDYQTLPTGEYHQESNRQDTHYDFYNYIGIHRNVYLS